MKHRYEKNVRVLVDLLGYCHLVGANTFHVGFSMEDATSTIEIKAQVQDLDPERVDELKKYLDMPRQHEIEQYYWNISGEEEIDSELSLVGMMVDRAEVSYERDILSVYVERDDPSTEA